MERLHQVVDKNGLQIPLPFIQQYGLQPGAKVTVELGPYQITVSLPITDPTRIEDLALRLTLRNLGDAAQVKAERDPSPLNPEGWRVNVFGATGMSPLGYLTFTQMGEYLPELSISFDEIRRIARERVALP
jgi:hypothetical protein